MPDLYLVWKFCHVEVFLVQMCQVLRRGLSGQEQGAAQAAVPGAEGGRQEAAGVLLTHGQGALPLPRGAQLHQVQSQSHQEVQPASEECQ